MNFSKFDLLGRDIDKNTPFFISLLGGHSAIKRFFGFECPLPIIQSNDVKSVLRQRLENPNDFVYPYAYMVLQNISMPKDGQSAKTVRRNSQGIVINETNSTITKFFGFQMSVGLELHFVTNDILQAVNFSLKALSLLNSDSMSFEVESENFCWKVSVTSDVDSISFPRSEKDNEADPEAFDMTCDIKITGYTGVIKDAPKINNLGKIKTNANLSNGPIVEG